jgi:hypothetical protein
MRRVDTLYTTGVRAVGSGGFRCRGDVVASGKGVRFIGSRLS